MGAIVGFYGLDGRPARADQISRMLATLAYRGPDGQASWIKGPVGLGHCMLYSTPESLQEILPSALGGLVITADARIDNREELIRSLGPDAMPAGQATDSDLILSAYRKWGERCVERLIGDFAFAIFDSQNERLFCARDHFGVRPFYFNYQPGNRFAFATDIKGILCLRDLPQRLDEIKIADYLLGRFDDKGRTFYADIRRLPPASAMVVGRSGIRIREYWKLDPTREIRLNSDREYAEAFHELFLQAVRCRLRSAFPIGSMLSGGLDSSSVACAARDLMMSGLEGELHTFSIVFDQLKESDERWYIHKVLATKGFMAHLICGDKASPFDGLDTVLNYQDEPFFAPNLFLARLGWRSANASGVRVLLDGLFGDNTVSHGIEHLNELARHWRWLALARELKKIIRRSDSKVPLWKSLRRYVVCEGIRPYVPERGLALWRMMRRREVDPVGGQCEIFSPEYCARINLRKRLAIANKLGRATKSSRQFHYDSLSSGMVDTALEVYNKGCSEFAIEPRYPFADKRLVELCLAIPGSQKVGDGYTRIVVRRALEHVLPAEICWRSGKGNLESSFINGFGVSRDWVGTTIRSSQRFLERFFNYQQIERRFNECLGGRSPHEEEFPLFLITVLARWTAKTGVS